MTKLSLCLLNRKLKVVWFYLLLLKSFPSVSSFNAYTHYIFTTHCTAGTKASRIPLKASEGATIIVPSAAPSPHSKPVHPFAAVSSGSSVSSGV